jgi:putative membrane protein
VALPEDPRVYFAAERTLLAWVRTGLGLMGFGFVVAKFGLYLHLLADRPVSPLAEAGAQWVGIVLVLVGTASTWVAARQFRGFARTLTGPELPAEYRIGPGPLVAYVLTVVGAGLAVYLVIS